MEEANTEGHHGCKSAFMEAWPRQAAAAAQDCAFGDLPGKWHRRSGQKWAYEPAEPTCQYHMYTRR